MKTRDEVFQQVFDLAALSLGVDIADMVPQDVDYVDPRALA